MVLFNDGDRVAHTKLDAWGPGQVLSATSDQLVKVVFVNAGVKTLHLQYASLKKLSGSAAKNAELDRLVGELEATTVPSEPELPEDPVQQSRAKRLRELDALVPNEDEWNDDDYYD